MTLLTPSSGTPEPIQVVLGSVAGPSLDDFFVLGYSHEYDRRESALHPEQRESTFVLRYRRGVPEVVVVLPQRLNDIWYSPLGRAYGVGEPRGVLSIDAQGASEVSIADVPGTFASVWGADDDHVFACGNAQPFWLYRQRGVWRRLALPEGVAGLWRVCGFAEDDVYAVSDAGEILHFDGRHVSLLDSRTTRGRGASAPLPDGRVCVAGHQGVLLCGNTRGWRAVDSGTDAPLLNIVPYQEGVCFVTAEGVWHFDGKTLPRRILPQGGRWLSRVGDGLLVVANENAWLFDGSTLVQLETTL